MTELLLKTAVVLFLSVSPREFRERVFCLVFMPELAFGNYSVHVPCPLISEMADEMCCHCREVYLPWKLPFSLT